MIAALSAELDGSDIDLASSEFFGLTFSFNRFTGIFVREPTGSLYSFLMCEFAALLETETSCSE